MVERPVPPPLADSIQRDLGQLHALTDSITLRALNASQLMGERARLAGLRPAHGRSPGGSCRLLRTANQTLAVNLPRAEDWELLPAWLERGEMPARWDALARELRGRSAKPLVSRARAMGLGVAIAEPCTLPAVPTFQIPNAREMPPRRAPRVLDLSALWAGPLCTHLLQQCGAEVIKVESLGRPDGARRGPPAFYDLLNQGKRAVALNLARRSGQRTLKLLLQRADIVVEAARPRALRQMGIQARTLVETQQHLTWIRITGYGCDTPGANWIAFGDDAGVAAGLSDMMRKATGHFQFAGDAIADPITGVRAALAAWRSWLAGGSRLLSFPLAQTAAQTLADEIERRGEHRVQGALRDWWRQALSAHPWAGVRPRLARSPAQALGADTAQVLTEARIPC